MSTFYSEDLDMQMEGIDDGPAEQPNASSEAAAQSTDSNTLAIPMLDSAWLNVNANANANAIANANASSSFPYDSFSDLSDMLLIPQAVEHSPFLSPITSPVAAGSAPLAFTSLKGKKPMLQTSFQNDISSQSFPGLHSQTFTPASDFASDDVNWLESFSKEAQSAAPYAPAPYAPAPTAFHSSMLSPDIDTNHVPAGWSSSTPSLMHRTESVLSYNSFESALSHNSFEDFSIDNVLSYSDVDPGSFGQPPFDKNSFGQSSSAHNSLDANSFGTFNFDVLAGGASNDVYMGAVDVPESLLSPSIDGSTTTPRPIPKQTKSGRRSGLTDLQKAHAARLRKIGACDLCRQRRARCDEGIPCSACKRYYRSNPEKLAAQPCRGNSLRGLADFILNTNAFPKGPHSRFLPAGHVIVPSDKYVALDLGFGHAPFRCRVSLVHQSDSNVAASRLMHNHVVYPWPPAAGTSAKISRRDAVFPAILADDEESIASQVEAHLSKLLSNKRQFQYFPVWFSQLKVLRLFYKYLLSLQPRARNPLKQAFQILILLHVGGDLRLVRDDATTAQINEQLLPGVAFEHISPCYIRAQLGPIFGKVAHKLMTDVLKQLESLSPLQDAAHFPMIIAAFSALFMGLESLQYHFAKVAHHSEIDASDVTTRDGATRNLDSFEAAQILLRFYQSTVCHQRLGALVDLPAEPDLTPITRVRSRAGSSASARWSANACPAAPNHGVLEFLKALRASLRAATPYIVMKDSMDPVVPASDMSLFFDRLLAKMYRLPPVA